jgi:hypothetical protein
MITTEFYNQTFLNLTPHAIVVQQGTDGEASVFPPSGEVARVSEVWREVAPFVFEANPGEIQGLPDPQEGIWLVVSLMVAEAAWKLGRGDVIAPATGAPGVRRNEAGHIQSVPGFRYRYNWIM